MKLAVMQPYFFPYLGYWQLINAVDHFVIFDDVNYRKRSYINRNSLLVNGRQHDVTLELSGASQNRLIRDINIGNNGEKILKTIFLAYSKAPCFKQVYSLLESVLRTDEIRLVNLLADSLSVFSEYMKIDTTISFSSDLDNNAAYTGKNRLIDLCTRLGADEYINSIGGQQLYTRQDFAEQNIQLNFLQSKLPPYKQFGEAFVPGLSIIDVLMFNDPGKVSSMLEKYSLC